MCPTAARSAVETHPADNHTENAPVSVLSFDISGSQIDGARDYQEDAFLITHLGGSDGGDANGSMVIVADGMGGHAAGNVASNMAVQTFNRHISSNFPHENISSVLYDAVLQANGSITATVAETAALKGMGCTLVACVLERNELRWVSVGDSHLYLLRDGVLAKKNADHSYGGFLDRMAEAGTPVEAEQGFSRNMLMSALTGDDIAEIDCPEEPLVLTAGDRVILSSDGLDTLPHDTIAEIASNAATPKECVDTLIKAVEEAGAPRQDNTTVVVIDVTEKAEPAPEPEPVAAPEPATAAPSVSAAPAPEEVPTEDAGSPFPVEDEPKRGFPAGLVVGLLLVIAAAGGGAFWFMGQDKAAPPPAPVEIIAEEDDGLTEIEPVEEEVVTPGEVAPPAQPATPTPPASGLSGQFRDPLKSGGEGPLMTWIPAGEFTMGSRISTSDPDQHPQHRVRLAQFAIGVYEVTIAEYRRFANATGRKMPNIAGAAGADEAEFPMFYVSWNEALAYAQWLSDQTGKAYSLPSEAQWEYAARAGTDLAYWWGRRLGRSNAHCFACDTGLDPRRPTAIGRFKPNPFGLYDTSGNVQEWVYDCYHGTYKNAPDDGSVFEGGDCTVRVLRGGSYSSGPEALRNASRDKFRFDKGNDGTGFRVVRTP